MGEIADGLINGDFDFYTGEYIGRGYGIPRTRNRSLEWEKNNYTRSKNEAFNGVSKYLKRHGFKDKEISQVIVEYVQTDGKASLKQRCIEIQRDFPKFVQFIHNKLKNNK